MSKTKQNTIARAMKTYNRLNKATVTVLYFIYKHQVYRVALNKLSLDCIILTNDSKSKGNKEKLRLSIKVNYKQYIIEQYNLMAIMTEKEFNAIATEKGYNKGQTSEYLEHQINGLEYKLDNIPFYIDGDLTNKEGQKVQVKFQNASICYLDTLKKLEAQA